MYAILFDGLFWNAEDRKFSPSPTLYPSREEATEAAQEDAKLAAHLPWVIQHIAE